VVSRICQYTYKLDEFVSCLIDVVVIMDNISIIKAKSRQQFIGISSYSKYSKNPVESKSFRTHAHCC